MSTINTFFIIIITLDMRIQTLTTIMLTQIGIFEIIQLFIDMAPAIDRLPQHIVIKVGSTNIYIKRLI